MVATPKSFLNPFLFSIRLPVAIPVATAGDSTGEARESSYLIRYADWMWFSFFFFLFYLFIFFYFFFSPFFYFIIIIIIIIIIILSLFFICIFLSLF